MLAAQKSAVRMAFGGESRGQKNNVDSEGAGRLQFLRIVTTCREQRKSVRAFRRIGECARRQMQPVRIDCARERDILADKKQ